MRERSAEIYDYLRPIYITCLAVVGVLCAALCFAGIITWPTAWWSWVVWLFASMLGFAAWGVYLLKPWSEEGA